MRKGAAQGAALGDLQLAVLEVLWSGGEMTTADVHQTVARHREIALTTVATVLQRLDKAGTVTHRMDGRQFLYKAAVSRQQLRRQNARALIRRFFDGDPASLVSHLVETDALSLDDLDRLKRAIRARSEKG